MLPVERDDRSCSGPGRSAPARDRQARVRVGLGHVSTTNDVVDGNITSITALIAAPGADGHISLREATLAANNTASNSGSPNTITVPAGTYNLNPSGVVGTGELQVGSAINQRTDIVGSGSPTIHQSNSSLRVFDLDPNVVGNIAVNISGLTISGGFAQAFGGGAILGGGTNDSLSLTNVTLTDNHCSGFFSGAGISWSPAGNVTISNSTFSNNTCASGGAGGHPLYDRQRLDADDRELDVLRQHRRGNRKRRRRPAARRQRGQSDLHREWQHLHRQSGHACNRHRRRHLHRRRQWRSRRRDLGQRGRYREHHGQQGESIGTDTPDPSLVGQG